MLLSIQLSQLLSLVLSVGWPPASKCSSLKYRAVEEEITKYRSESKCLRTSSGSIYGRISEEDLVTAWKGRAWWKDCLCQREEQGKLKPKINPLVMSPLAITIPFIVLMWKKKNTMCVFHLYGHQKKSLFLFLCFYSVTIAAILLVKLKIHVITGNNFIYYPHRHF